MAEEEERNEKPKVFTLSIRNLSFTMDEDKLKDIISEYAKPKDIRIPNGRKRGEKKGFGFVEMETEEDMNKVIECLNGKELDGKNLIVEVARSKPRPKGSKKRRRGDGRYRDDDRRRGDRRGRRFDDDSRSPSPRRYRRDRSPSPPRRLRRRSRRDYDDYYDDYDDYYEDRRRSRSRYRRRYDYYSDDDYYDRRRRRDSPPPRRSSKRDRSPPSYSPSPVPDRKDRTPSNSDWAKTQQTFLFIIINII